MHPSQKISINLCAAFFACGIAFSQQDSEELFSKTNDRSWVESASKYLTDEAIEELEKNRMVLVDEGHRQVFSNYLDHKSDLPHFVTSDALLHVFHVLLEETLQRIEFANIAKLEKFLDGAMVVFDSGSKSVDDSEQEFIPSARKKVEIILGVAAVLLGEDVNEWSDNGEIRAIIETEVANVIQATEVLLPEWLGKPRAEFAAIDYQKFKPGGIYQNSELLSNYFRAVKWLQSVPLWLDSDEDYIAIGALARGMQDSVDPWTGKSFDDWRDSEERTEFSFAITRRSGIESLFGNQASVDLRGVAEIFSQFLDDLPHDPFTGNKQPPILLEGPLVPHRSKLKEKILKSYPASARSHFRFVTNSTRVGVVFMPEYRLFDSDLFHQTVTMDPNREFPDGLELLVNAGSTFAKLELLKNDGANAVEWLEENRYHGHGYIYAEWWQTVSLLQSGIPESAPVLFQSASWQQKSCESLLASWAHMRYSAALHAEVSAVALGDVSGHSGFVEPNPAFYLSLARLCDQLVNLGEGINIFSPNVAYFSMQLEENAKLLREGIQRVKSEEVSSFFGDFSGNRYFQSSELLKDVGIIVYYNPFDEESVESLIKQMSTISAELKSGKRVLVNDRKAIRKKWRELQSLCRDLHVIAIKQLNLIELTAQEKHTIASIGQKLGKLEFYTKNSYLAPNDDAPRISVAYVNQMVGKRWHVATGRPMTMYLLYPEKGKQILCRGGVMSYYEHVDSRQLNNAEWKTLLDGKDAPKRPDWTLPVIEKKVEKN